MNIVRKLRLAEAYHQAIELIRSNKTLKCLVIGVIITFVCIVLIPDTLGGFEKIKVLLIGVLISLFGLILKEATNEPLLKLTGSMQAYLGVAFAISVFIHNIFN